MVEVSLFPIFASGIAAILIGFVWYHPKLFGDYWMRESGITGEKAERARKRMPILAFFGLILYMMIAWAMSYLGIALGIYDWQGAVFDLGFWVWLGFAAPILLGSTLWEIKPLKLFLVNAGYWFVTLIAMSLILFYGATVIGPTYDLQSASQQVIE